VLKIFALQARSSGGERFPDTEEVVGSNPIAPTKQIKGLRFWPFPLFSFLLPFFAAKIFNNHIIVATSGILMAPHPHLSQATFIGIVSQSSMNLILMGSSLLRFV
jgi:hypothetical protein